MQWCCEIPDVEKGMQLIRESKEWLVKLENKRNLGITYFNFSIIAFLNKDYEQALQFLAYPLDQRKNTKYQFLWHFGGIFKVIIYFECNNFSLLESTIRAVYRRL